VAAHLLIQHIHNSKLALHQQPESVATLRSLAPFGEPAVGLVVATSVGPAAVLDEATRMSLIEFCIEHGLELIDLDETADDDDQEDGNQIAGKISLGKSTAN